MNYKYLFALQYLAATKTSDFTTTIKKKNPSNNPFNKK